jgi:hypothetical protein
MVFSREELTTQRWIEERPKRREFLAKPSQSLSPTGPANHLVPFPLEFAACIFQLLIPESWIVSVEKSERCMVFDVPGSMHEKQLPRRGFRPVSFEIHREF